MRALRIAAAGIGALAALGLPATALAGEVVRDANSITYNADPATGSGERVDVGIESGLAFVFSVQGVTSTSLGCNPTDFTRVECPISPAFIVNLLGFDDSLSGTQVTGPQTLEAHGRGGGDTIDGTQNADRLYGDEGGDTLFGTGGNDVLDGGAGDDYLHDGQATTRSPAARTTTRSRWARAATTSPAATGPTPPTSGRGPAR